MTAVEYQSFFQSYCHLYKDQQLAVLFVGRNGEDLWLNDRLIHQLDKLGIQEPIKFIDTFFKEQEERIFRDLFKARIEKTTLICHYQIRTVQCRLLISAFNLGKNKFVGYQIEVQELQEISDLPVQELIQFPFNNPNPVVRLSKAGYLKYANPSAQEVFCTDNTKLIPEIQQQFKEAIALFDSENSVVSTRIYTSDKTFLSSISLDTGGINVYAVDITESVNQEKEQSSNIAFLETVTNNSSNAVILLDSTKRIVYFNQKAQDDSGVFLNHRLVKGNALPDFKDQQFTIKLHRAIDTVFKRALKFTFEISTQIEFETENWFRFLVSPVFDSDGAISGVYLNSVNITQSRLYEAELQRTKNFYETILNQIPADIAVFDLDHSYMFLNPKAVANEEIRKWMIGKNDYDYFQMKGLGTEIADKRRSIFNEVVNSRKTHDTIDKHTRADGESNYVLRRFYPYVDDDELKLVIGYCIDITPIKLAEQDTLAALDKERELNQLKSHFVQMASHEFRTPLATIQSSMDILNLRLNRSEFLPEDIRHTFKMHHNRIEQEISWMTEIMNNILILGKLDAGRMNLRPELISIEQLISDEIQEKETISGLKNMVKISVSGNSREMLLDSRLMRHVIGNLISNALKYSEGMPAPEVYIDYLENNVNIRVRDFGIGIPEEEIPYLFTSFYRATNTENIKGTGIGLVIIKQLVEMHAGKVSLTSVINEGTEFTVELPDLAND